MLGLWKNNGRVFQGLSQMARDVFAVPCTGAGVECEFSKDDKLLLGVVLNCIRISYKDV